ncbi:uncharacterized protein VTP21DRAFT_10094 [Calcarisporiella thermophila]|uniref:uncharacterized protein n=1 Tax=Calcarisporiella thermophila TaxID=911321 RepID=UPI003742FEC6
MEHDEAMMQQFLSQMKALSPGQPPETAAAAAAAMAPDGGLREMHYYSLATHLHTPTTPEFPTTAPANPAPRAISIPARRNRPANAVLEFPSQSHSLPVELLHSFESGSLYCAGDDSFPESPFSPEPPILEDIKENGGEEKKPGEVQEDKKLDEEELLRQKQLLYERRRRRRESHNAVERRRRDHINEKIQELSSLLPDWLVETARPNKGIILRKSVDYIRVLQQQIHEQATRSVELEARLKRYVHGELAGRPAGHFGGGNFARSSYGESATDFRGFPFDMQQLHP